MGNREVDDNGDLVNPFDGDYNEVDYIVSYASNGDIVLRVEDGSVTEIIFDPWEARRLAVILQAMAGDFDSE